MKSWVNSFVLLFLLNLSGSFSEEPRLFRCDYRYSSAAKGWFKYFDVPVTWFDARMRCALEGAVLASPTTPQLKVEMTGFINLTDNEEILYEVFTGIHATLASGDYHTIEGTPLSVIPRTWAPNEPDNKDNKERCLTLNSIGQLADVWCNETRPFVCYRAEYSRLNINECGTIDPEYHLDRRTHKCYKFHKHPKVFGQAALACSAEGGHLAIINSATEATVLKELFAKYPDSSLVGMQWKNVALIGFHDWSDHTEWRTIQGQTLTEAGYDKFGPKNPDNLGGQYCGAIFRSGDLDDMSCDHVLAFICEKSPDYNAACSLQN
uniref:IML19 n=1 Tax=Mythimna separata TaxID=271217 RepID=A0A8F3C7H2_MYTSE|nr:IML19 [Mythimna separata]